MKITNILLALTLLFTLACNSEKAEDSHGHAHDAAEHGHSHEEGSSTHAHEEEAPHQQEEFIIGKDTTRVKTDSSQHTHEDGSTHHDH